MRYNWTGIVSFSLNILAVLLVSSSALAQTTAISPAELEFFEKQVRPVLVQNCHSCHSAQARTVFANLTLDSRGGMTFGKSDEYGFRSVEDKVHIHDMHATILHLLGLDHERLTYRYSGRDFRLTDVYGRVVDEIIA